MQSFKRGGTLLHARSSQCLPSIFCQTSFSTRLITPSARSTNPARSASQSTTGESKQSAPATIEELRSELAATEAKAKALRESIVQYKDPNKKTILVLGAGRSSPACVDYLLQHAKDEGWYVKVGDGDESHALQRIGKHPAGIAFRLDANDPAQREAEIRKADIVVSLLPPHMHYLVAKDCIKHATNMVSELLILKTFNTLCLGYRFLCITCNQRPRYPGERTKCLDHDGMWC